MNIKMNMITKGTIVAAVVALVALLALGGSWYTLDQTERGVLLRNGAVIGTAQPVSNCLCSTASRSSASEPADLKISVTLRAPLHHGVRLDRVRVGEIFTAFESKLQPKLQPMRSGITILEPRAL